MEKHSFNHRIVGTGIVFILIITAVVSIEVISCAQQQTPHIEGAWNLVYMHSIKADTLAYLYPGNITGNAMKMWSKEHFAFVWRVGINDSLMDNYGGGTYTLDGNHYIENVLYHRAKNLLGSINMLIEVKGDSLIQTWPTDENWQIDKSNYNIEKYIRLD